jgi:FkbM family methyltransferase
MRLGSSAYALALAGSLLGGGMPRPSIPQTHITDPVYPRTVPGGRRRSRRKIVSEARPLYSHGNEEIIIRDFFQDRRKGFFLDVGCGHPIDDSNTYYLEERLGWSGIGVDALPEMAAKWRRNRPASRFFNYIVTDHADTVDPFYRAELRARDISSIQKPERDPSGNPVGSEEIRVPTITLTKLLERQGISKIDLLSMDIEGSEPLALAGFDIERFKPALACVEAKPGNRERILRYFSTHHYHRIETYRRYDEMNYYFTPDERAAAGRKASAR